MSLWNDFLDNIAKPIAKGIATGAKSLGETFLGTISSPAQAISGIVIPAGTNIGLAQMRAQNLSEAARKGISDNLQYEAFKSAQSNDLMLQLGIALEERVISPAITRPLSTVSLLADPNSELYQPGPYEKGFQLKDISRAYTRSEFVSPMQSLTKSVIWENSPLGGIQDIIFKIGDIDAKDINLWDDEDIQKNYVDNPVGQWYTGLGDFVVSNIAIAGAFKGIGVVGSPVVNKFVGRPAKSALERSGLSTKSDNYAQYEKDVNDGILFEQTGGLRGRQTVRGASINNLAKSTDPDYVFNTVKNEWKTTNERIVNIVRETSDPAVIRDLYLADKGYLPALDRLSRNESAKLAELSDLPGFLRAKNVLDDKIYQPEGVALDRIRAAFEDLIEKNPQFKKTRDAFFDPSGNLKVFGAEAHLPIEPILGKDLFIKTSERRKKFAAAATTRDFSKIGGIEERVFSTGRAGGLAVRAIRFTGTYKPLEYVTFSGARPLDGLVELNSFFDDFTLFSNGANKIKVGPNEFKTAAQYRNDVKIKFMAAANDIERKVILDELDVKLGEDILRTLGLYGAEADAFIATVKANISDGHNALARKGFGVDYDGHGILIEPETQPMLADSHRLVPWNRIEKELIKASKDKKLKRGIITAEQAAKNVFELFNKYWSFDVLARPSYIVKQSWFEPILSAGLSQGFSFLMAEIPNATRNSLLNNRNRVLDKASRVLNKNELESVTKAVDNVSKQLEDSIAILDNLNAEMMRILDPEKTSPATRKNNLPSLRAALREADELVDALELEYRSAIKPYVGNPPSIPSISALQRRLDYIESQTPSSFKAKNAAAIANAKSAIGRAQGELNTLMPDKANLTKIYDDIAKTYDQIDNVIIKDLGVKRAEQAAVFGKTEKYKKRYYGRDSQYRMINGQWMKIDSIFDENNLGAALRAEFENGRTVATTYLGEYLTGSRLAGMSRRAPGAIVDVQSPVYFEELAYLSNRFLRNDPMVRLMLEGADEKVLFQWALTPEGKAYVSQWGEISRANLPDFIKDRVGYVNRYLPNAEAKALVLKGDVTSVGLQKALSKDIDRLSAIQPMDFNYDMTAGILSKGGLAAADEALNKAMAVVWRTLTSAENPIRWVFAEKVFADVVARKANSLAQQGIEITPKVLNSLRPAATREALIEAEKTFYNVRRANRGLWAARTLVAFPTASVNAFYRYGRFAIKNPARVSGFLHSYQSFFRSFGIDKYGLPVEDPRDAVYILIPGTKEAGLFDGEGVRLSARSIGFLLNWPGPSWISTVPIGFFLKAQPGAEDVMKQVLGPTYEVLFPYGPPVDKTSLAATFLPSWARDFYTYLTGDEGRKDYLESVKSVANYYRALEEMGLGKFPGMEKVRQDARELYRLKAVNSAASIFGVPIKVDTKPTLLFEQYYDLLVNKYRSYGLSNEDARTYAGDEFLANIAPDFPLDRITYKGSTAKFFSPPTQESFARVFVDNPGIVNELYKISPELVGLMTIDLDDKKENFNMSVYKLLKNPNTKLPTGQLINEVALTPEEEENRRQINRTWVKYNDMKDTLDKIAINQYQKKSIRSVPELQAALTEYGNTILREENEDWWETWQKSQTEDKTFEWARGLAVLLDNEEFMNKYGKNSRFWQNAKTFIDVRESIANVYKSLDDTQQKSDLRQKYLSVIDELMTTWHPKLQEIINRYFDNDYLKRVK